MNALFVGRIISAMLSTVIVLIWLKDTGDLQYQSSYQERGCEFKKHGIFMLIISL